MKDSLRLVNALKVYGVLNLDRLTFVAEYIYLVDFMFMAYL